MMTFLQSGLMARRREGRSRSKESKSNGEEDSEQLLSIDQYSTSRFWNEGRLRAAKRVYKQRVPPGNEPPKGLKTTHLTA